MSQWFKLSKNKCSLDKEKLYFKFILITKNNNGGIKINDDTHYPPSGMIFLLSNKMNFTAENGIEFFCFSLHKKARVAMLEFLSSMKIDAQTLVDKISDYKNDYVINNNFANYVFFQCNYKDYVNLLERFQDVEDTKDLIDSYQKNLSYLEIQLLIHSIVVKKFTSKNLEGDEILDDIYIIKKYIDNNLKENLKVSNLAKKFGWNRNDLNSTFKIHVDKSIKEYIIFKRVEKASDLLRTTSLSVDEISEICGINDSTYFYRLFKTKTGYTPREYRMLNLTGGA